jgi:hypothetical protein
MQCPTNYIELKTTFKQDKTQITEKNKYKKKIPGRKQNRHNDSNKSITPQYLTTRRHVSSPREENDLPLKQDKHEEVLQPIETTEIHIYIPTNSNNSSTK